MYIYINSTSQSLSTPNIKSPVSAKKFWFTTVAHSTVSKSNNSANSKQNAKKIIYGTDAHMGSIDDKKPEDEKVTLLSISLANNS